jgi:transposase
MEKTKTNSKTRRRGEAVYRDPWRIPDELWEKIQPLLPPGKPHPLGCHNPPVEPRKVMDAIFFVVRTGCPWRALNANGICSSSTAHRWFQVWNQAGVFVQLCEMGLLEHGERKGIGWRWSSEGGAVTEIASGGKRKQTRPRRSVRARRPRKPLHQGPSRPGRGGRQQRSTRRSADAGDVGQCATRPSPALPGDTATPVPGPGLAWQYGAEDVGLCHLCPAPVASDAGEQTPGTSPELPRDDRPEPPGAESCALASHPWGEKVRELLRVASAALRPGGLLRRWPAGTDSVLVTIRMLTVAMAVCILALVGLTVSRWRFRNPQVQQIVDRPTAIEQFAQAGHRGRRADSGDTIPLIVQARALALHLNPPVEAQAVAAAPSPLRSAMPVRPPPPAFQLCGTSCYPAQPERSMALIWERGANGGTRRWVREGTQLGPFTVHEIRPGAILCRDGNRISEILLERQAARSLVQNQAARVVRADPTSLGGGPKVDSNAVAK